MPLVPSSYQSPILYFNHHLETVIPALLRKVKNVNYERERISTPDDDFLDLDWIRNGHKKLVIICHGLEGNSERPYMKGMAKIFADNDYDVLAWNFRGCSGEVNRQVRAYHSGATDDLQVVIDHVFSLGYEFINLIGFSLGGNIVLKYLGEQGVNMDSRICKGVALSVPLHLHTSCEEITKSKNFLYSKRFLRNLKKKVIDKAAIMPDKIGINGLDNINSIIEFDDHFTAPVHGFKNALHYYESCSSLYFLEGINVPTLIINALNDSFLSTECYPIELAEKHQLLHLETPDTGGHCGFPGSDEHGYLWSERRALEFIETQE